MNHWNIFLKGRYWLFVVITSTLLGRLSDIWLRECFGVIIDQTIFEDGKGGLWIAVEILTAVLFAARFLTPFANEHYEASLKANLYEMLENKILYAEQSAGFKFGLGEASTYFTSDVSGIIQYLKRMLQFFIPDLFTFAISVFLIFRMSISFGIVTLTVTVFSVAVMIKMSKKVIQGNKLYQEQLEQANDQITTSFFNAEFIKVSRMEDERGKEYDHILDKLHNTRKRIALKEALLFVPTIYSTFITILSMAAYGSYCVSSGIITTGQLFTAITLVETITSPVMRFENSIMQIRKASVHLKRLAAYEKMKEECQTLSHFEVSPEIYLRDVTFKYPDSEPIFSKLSVSWVPDKVNCIVGENGAGKSTFCKILGGVYDIEEGKIGMPISENARNALREEIVIHTQETVLFSDTIIGNLQAGKEIAIERIRQVCKQVGIDEDIYSLPLGYETILLPDGAPLSGGQKQRLCLARSLLREAEMYIFDEPTAGLDIEHVKIVIRAIRELALNHYILVITHDPLLIEAADSIIDWGRINQNER